jgi:hypothetical protein
MATHRNALASGFMPLVRRVHSLSDWCRIVVGSFPNIRAAFSADNLPLSFILKRDSHRRRTGNGKWHIPLPHAMSGKITPGPGIYLLPQRVYVRSALRANIDRPGRHRSA